MSAVETKREEDAPAQVEGAMQRGLSKLRIPVERYDTIYRVGVAAVCIACFAMLSYLAANTSLWLDEMFEVEYCRTSTLAQIVFIDPFTPPLFNIVAHTWYQVVPYGELWLRLPSIAFVTAAVFLAALAGRRLDGRRTGFIAAFLLLINAKVFTQCGLTFRTYGLLLMLSALLVYLYVRRLQTENDQVSWGLALGTGLTMLALGYTHYFGILLCCMFFVVDLYLLARGRLNGARAKIFSSYGLAVVLYVPWLFVAFRTLFHVTGQSGLWTDGAIHWQRSTADLGIHGLLYWLCGECAETLGLFHVAAIILVTSGAWRAYHKMVGWREQVPLLSLLFAIVGMIFVMWAYATFINTRSMFWVERYFTPLIVCIVLVTAWGVTKIFSWIPTSEPVRFVAAFLCIVLLVPTAIGTVNNDLGEGSSTRFYRNLTSYLEQRKDISSDKTLVLAIVNTTDRGRNLSAWKHYYFNRKDTRDFKVDILDGLDPSVQLNPYDLLQYKTVYVTRQHFDPPLPDTYAEVFKKYFKLHETDNPGGGETVYYTKR